MSTLAFGRIVAKRGSIPDASLRNADASTEGQDENKLISALAALFPVEVLAGHALILAASTTTTDDGSTTINPGATVPLGASLIVLMVVAVAMFAIGNWGQAWKRVDYIRAAVPPFAFLAWTGLIGTSALTPWLAEINKGTEIDRVVVVVAAVALGAIVAAVGYKVAPPTT
jgi:hypothetical protein